MNSESDVYKSLLTPLSFIQRSVDVYPEKTAIVHGDKRYTYREFGERVNRLAWALKSPTPDSSKPPYGCCANRRMVGACPP